MRAFSYPVGDIMPRSFGLPCHKKDCPGRCHVTMTKHSLKDEYLRRIRKCDVCGWKRRTIEVFLPVERRSIDGQ